MNVNNVLTRNYENVRLHRRPKTNPIQTQIKANFTTIASTPASTFCWPSRTEKSMLINRVNGKCQIRKDKNGKDI